MVISTLLFSKFDHLNVYSTIFYQSLQIELQIKPKTTTLRIILWLFGTELTKKLMGNCSDFSLYYEVPGVNQRFLSLLRFFSLFLSPQVALRYLIQKVRSVNERESLCALEVSTDRVSVLTSNLWVLFLRQNRYLIIQVICNHSFSIGK